MFGGGALGLGLSPEVRGIREDATGGIEIDDKEKEEREVSRRCAPCYDSGKKKREIVDGRVAVVLDGIEFPLQRFFKFQTGRRSLKSLFPSVSFMQ